MKQILFLLSICIVFLGQAKAETPNDVESATRRGLARVKQAASDWQDNKTCFSCHHQTLPMLAALEGEILWIAPLINCFEVLGARFLREQQFPGGEIRATEYRKS